MTRLGSTSRLAWVICGLTVAAAFAVVVLVIADPNSAGPAHASPSGPTAHDTPAGGYVPYAVLTAIVFSTFAVVGAVVATRCPRNAVGWLIAVAALMWTLAVLSNGVYWHLAFARAQPPAAADFVAWFGTWTFLPAFVLLLGLAPLLFPTGAPPGPRWRVVGWTAAIAGAVATVSNALAPGPLDTADYPWVDNPFGVEGLGLRTLAKVSFVPAGAAALGALISLVVRYRRARGIERLQLRWVAAAACLLVVGAVGGSAASGWLGSGAGWLAMLLGLLAVAAGLAVAMLRYRLYDIDVVINRALVYGALTATLALMYLGGVLLLQLALSGITNGSGLAVAVSTLAVAALFRPARARIQEAVDRRFYRRKYDAQRTLESFSARLRDEVALDALSAELRAVVGDAMQPAHVSLWLRAPADAP
jgi:hypothetical protein